MNLNYYSPACVAGTGLRCLYPSKPLSLVASLPSLTYALSSLLGGCSLFGIPPHLFRRKCAKGSYCLVLFLPL